MSPTAPALATKSRREISGITLGSAAPSPAVHTLEAFIRSDFLIINIPDNLYLARTVDSLE
jgi:hypothetical protein